MIEACLQAAGLVFFDHVRLSCLVERLINPGQIVFSLVNFFSCYKLAKVFDSFFISLLSFEILELSPDILS